jgi:hypothetical protein
MSKRQIPKLRSNSRAAKRESTRTGRGSPLERVSAAILGARHAKSLQGLDRESSLGNSRPQCSTSEPRGGASSLACDRPPNYRTGIGWKRGVYIHRHIHFRDDVNLSKSHVGIPMLDRRSSLAWGHVCSAAKLCQPLMHFHAFPHCDRTALALPKT